MTAVPRRRHALPALAVLAAVAWLATPSSAATVAPYRGLATWVDIYDAGVLSAPEHAAAEIARHGVGTVYLETANYRQSTSVVRRGLVGRFLEAAHAAGMDVVAWYLPGFAKPALDVRRSLAAIEFESPRGHRFDGFALDIESPEVKSPSRRTARLLRVARAIRAAVGPDYALGAIIPSPRGMELSPTYWPGFPYAALARTFDVFLPMVYFTYRTRGRVDTRSYVAASIDVLRRETGDPEVPIHVIGGVADRMRRGQLGGYVDAVCADRLFGASLYDWETTTRRHRGQLGRLAACVAS